MSDYCLGMTTIGTAEDAARLAKELVDRRLVACANVIPGLRSFYHWQGKLCDETEWLVLLKTHVEKIDAIKQAFKELHPYEEPELVFVPIGEGSPTYLQWLDSSIK